MHVFITCDSQQDGGLVRLELWMFFFSLFLFVYSFHVSDVEAQCSLSPTSFRRYWETFDFETNYKRKANKKLHPHGMLYTRYTINLLRL